MAYTTDRQEIIAESVPARLQKAIDGTRFTAVQAGILKAIREGRSGLIGGANGTGKSLILWRSMVDRACGGRFSVQYTAYSLFSAIRDSIGGTGVDKFIKSSGLTDCDFLAIDEIDKSFGTDSEFAWLTHIIGARYERRLQTVVAGNFMTLRQAAEIIGQSSFDRLSAYDDGFTAILDGDSFRRIRRAVNE